MSTTTQILFNSPALHSLKRDQLVKLCKIHSIKASGKSVDLIDRLKLHAQSMPKDSPLSIAARSEGQDNTVYQILDEKENQLGESVAVAEDGSRNKQMPRPSEQWEVMESIQELEETSSQGTLSSLRTLNTNAQGMGEFGTAGSKASSVSSSIKALASSLGLKRNNSKSNQASSSKSKLTHPYPRPSSRNGSDDNELANSIPYSSLPTATTPPQNDHFTFDPTVDNDPRSAIFRLEGGVDIEPLPGHSLRPGVPAPTNARLSLGLGLGAPLTPTRKDQPTTTIRLISNNHSNQAGDFEDNHNTNNDSSDWLNTAYVPGSHGTPQLKPFHTTFDLVLGSPAPAGATTSALNFSSLSAWPPSNPDRDEGMMATPAIYPALPNEDMPGQRKSDEDEGVFMPGSLDAPKAIASSSSSSFTPSRRPPSTSGASAMDPFIFGSPLPQHRVSDAQFRVAAASVLEEMNQRLREQGIDGIGMDLVGKLKPGSPGGALKFGSEYNDRVMKPLPGGKGEIKQRFERLHEEEFRKMEGIDQVAKRKGASSPKKTSVSPGGDGEEVVVGKKRKSSVLVEKPQQQREDRKSALGPRLGNGRPPGRGGVRVSSTRVISNSRRAIPGAFGGDDEDDAVGSNREDEVEERIGKRAKVKAAEHSDEMEDQKTTKDEEEEEEQRKIKEREVIKRKLELQKAKRRSSMGVNKGRVSVTGKGRVSVGRPSGVLVKPKPKPSRFGFLASAKNIVQNVWNRSKPTPATTTPSALPKPSVTKGVLAKAEPAPAVTSVTKIASLASTSGPVRPSVFGVTPAGSRIPSSRLQVKGKEKEKEEKAISSLAPSIASTNSRARSPIPTFGSTSSMGTKGSRVGSLVTSSSSNSNTRTSVTSNSGSGGVSSIGTRSSLAVASRGGSIVSSMGAKKGVAGAGTSSTRSSTSTSQIPSLNSTGSSRLSGSRLFAPTASSLAKTTRISNVGSGGGSTSSRNITSGLARPDNTGGKGKGGSVQNSKSPSPQPPPPTSTFSPPTVALKVYKKNKDADTGGGVDSPLSKDVPKRSSQPFSPRPAGSIFSKPLEAPPAPPVSGIPVRSPTRGGGGTTSSGPQRQKSATGRKPRISRSKVIARLASQRAGATSGGGSASNKATTIVGAGGSATTADVLSPGVGKANGPRSSVGVRGKRTRSSIGVKVQRASFAGSGGGGGRKEDGLRMSHKKRARQSEYIARRRSEKDVELRKEWNGVMAANNDGGGTMDVDRSGEASD